MFWQDSLMFALMEDVDRVMILVMLLLFGLTAVAFIAELRNPPRDGGPPGSTVFGAILFVALSVQIMGFHHRASSIRTALSRPEVEIAIEDDVVVFRAPASHVPDTVFGRPAQVVDSALVVRFSRSRLEAVERVIEQDSALYVAYTELRRLSMAEPGDRSEDSL